MLADILALGEGLFMLKLFMESGNVSALVAREDSPKSHTYLFVILDPVDWVLQAQLSCRSCRLAFDHQAL